MEGSTVASIYEPALYSLTSRLRALESKPVFSLKTISDDSRCHPALPGTDAVLLEVKAGWHRPFRMTASTSQEARPHTSVPAQEQTPYALYITERGLSAIQDHILSRIKARCHKTTVPRLKAVEIYDSCFRLLLRGSAGAHSPLLLQRCAAVPHESQRQKRHGCKQGVGSGRPNLYSPSQ